MRKMPASSEVQSHKGVAGLEKREKDFGVCRRTRVRLHVCKLAAKKFCNALNREPFSDVHELAAAIVTFSRQAFGIFVRENRPLRFENRPRDDVLRSDQLDFVALAAKFEFD